MSEPETTLTHCSEEHDHKIVPYEAPQLPSPQDQYSQTLAQNAGPGCASLPKGELVMKSGYILASQILFPTIFVKKVEAELLGAIQLPHNALVPL